MDLPLDTSQSVPPPIEEPLSQVEMDSTAVPIPSISIHDGKYEQEPEALAPDEAPPPLEKPLSQTHDPLEEYVGNEHPIYPKVGDIIFSIELNETSKTPRWIMQKFRRLDNLTKQGNLKRTPDGFIRAQCIAPGDPDDVANTEIYDLPRDNLDYSEEACKRRCDRSNGINIPLAQAMLEAHHL